MAISITCDNMYVYFDNYFQEKSERRDRDTLSCLAFVEKKLEEKSDLKTIIKGATCNKLKNGNVPSVSFVIGDAKSSGTIKGQYKCLSLYANPFVNDITCDPLACIDNFKNALENSKYKGQAVITKAVCEETKNGYIPAVYYTIKK